MRMGSLRKRWLSFVIRRSDRIHIAQPTVALNEMDDNEKKVGIKIIHIKTDLIFSLFSFLVFFYAYFCWLRERTRAVSSSATINRALLRLLSFIRTSCSRIHYISHYNCAWLCVYSICFATLCIGARVRVREWVSAHHFQKKNTIFYSSFFSFCFVLFEMWLLYVYIYKTNEQNEREEQKERKKNKNRRETS